MIFSNRYILPWIEDMKQMIAALQDKVYAPRAASVPVDLQIKCLSNFGKGNYG
jgi:hypothetical protein